MQSESTIPPLGWRLLRFETLKSTNRRALEFQSDQPLHGCVFLATQQTGGRGRQGRHWHSPANLGLYASIIFQHRFEDVPTQLLSMMMAVSICDVLKDTINDPGTSVDIKWPNDILVNGKKICGILGEMRSGEPEKQRIVIGFSINIHHTQDDFPAEFAHRATSLAMEGVAVSATSREELLMAVVKRANDYFNRLRSEGGEHLIRRFTRDSSIVSGKRLRIEIDRGDIVTGTSCGLNDDGSLQFRLDSGLEIPLYAGEVHLLKD